jgi:hypothetical protein
LAAGLGLSTTLINDGPDAARKAVKTVRRLIGNVKYQPALGPSLMSLERRDLVHRLFWESNVPTKILPAASWSKHTPDVELPSGQWTYGHEAKVCFAMTDFLCRDVGAEYDYNENFEEPPGDLSKVIIGSGASNREAATYIGTPEQPIFRTSSCKLHYGIARGGESLRRRQYGEVIERRSHTICDSRSRAVHNPRSDKSIQLDDYLLVTRVPGEVEGSSVTIFAGLHGPGTRSAELLFSQDAIAIEDLRTLANIIRLKDHRIPYFQAVFRAKHFVNFPTANQTDSDVASALELVIKGSPP